MDIPDKGLSLDCIKGNSSCFKAIRRYGDSIQLNQRVGLYLIWLNRSFILPLWCSVPFLLVGRFGSPMWPVLYLDEEIKVSGGRPGGGQSKASGGLLVAKAALYQEERHRISFILTDFALAS